MSLTPKFGITELEAAQSQPEIVVNEGTRLLETMSQLIVIDKDLSAPPSAPDDGDTYLVPSGATGEWANYPFHIAVAIGGDWFYVAPRIGYIAYVEDEGVYYQYSAGSPSGWSALDLGIPETPVTATITVQDIGSPDVTFNGIQTIQFTGNVVVEQVNATTIKITVL